ncbi:MAG: hypothetical protein Q7T14_14035, partial [Aestuariivirga sp.]|nr:hypothetical protein [Aestuariivirga sp.]
VPKRVFFVTRADNTACHPQGICELLKGFRPPLKFENGVVASLDCMCKIVRHSTPTVVGWVTIEL